MLLAVPGAVIQLHGSRLQKSCMAGGPRPVRNSKGDSRVCVTLGLYHNDFSFTLHVWGCLQRHGRLCCLLEAGEKLKVWV